MNEEKKTRTVRDLLGLPAAPEGRRYLVRGYNGWGAGETALEAFTNARRNMGRGLPDEGARAHLAEVDPETNIGPIDGSLSWPETVAAPVDLGEIEFRAVDGLWVAVYVRVGSLDLSGASWSSPDDPDRLDDGLEEEGDVVGTATISPTEVARAGLDPMEPDDRLRVAGKKFLVESRGFPTGIAVEEVFVE